MTRDEAVMWLEYKSGDIYDYVFYSGYEVPEWEDYEYEALCMAIRSLKAWGEVIDDLKNCIAKGVVLVPNAFMNAGIKMTIEIINKHLKEVEDDKE